jgi:hypothetical protein
MGRGETLNIGYKSRRHSTAEAKPKAAPVFAALGDPTRPGRARLCAEDRCRSPI